MKKGRIFRLGAVLCGAAFSFGVARAEVAAITSQNADLVTLLDLEAMTVLAELSVPGKPAAVAVGAQIMTIATETALLHVFDLSGRPLAVWPVEGAPFGVAIHPERGTALVTDITGFLREIDPETGQELRVWPLGAVPSGVAAGEGLIVVSNRDEDSVSLIGEEIRTLKVGAHPFGVTLHEGRAYVTDVFADQVSVIDLAQGAVVGHVPTGRRPYAVAFSGGKGFVTNQYAASLTVFDAATLAPLGEIETDEYPEGIDVSADGRIFVANWFSDSLQVIDPESLEVMETLEMPAGPRAFGVFIGGAP